MQDDSIIPQSQIHLIVVIPAVLLAAFFFFSWTPLPQGRRPKPQPYMGLTPYAPIKTVQRPFISQALSAEKVAEIKEKQEMCVECHAAADEPTKTFEGDREVSIGLDWAKFRTSPHGKGLTCDQCHTGYEKYYDEGEHDYFEGSYEAFQKKASAACGTCHEATQKEMGASAHGGELTCVKCHGFHEIKGTSVDPMDVGAYCGACHKKALEAKDNVHARAVEAGHRYAPTCISCHGFGSSHGVTADRGRMADSCGQCHVKNREDLAGSAHGGKVTCVKCHGSHEIGGARLAPSRAAAYCGGCHTDIAAEYGNNVHEVALAKGVKGSPSCLHCHGSTHSLRPIERGKEGGYSDTFLSKRCASCHDQLSSDLEEKHDFLLPVRLHLGPNVGCACHTAKTAGAHILGPDNQAVKGMEKEDTCKLCHHKEGKLLSAVTVKKNAYVIGATREWWLDLIGIAIVVMTFVGMPLGHGALRVLAGMMRKGAN